MSRYVSSNNKNNGNNYAPVCAYAILIKVLTTGGWHHPPSSRLITRKMKQHVTIEDVTLAYYECRRTKRRTTSQIEYELDYEMNNLQLWRELNNGTYQIGQSIGFCITYPKLREVFAAKFRDRVVHHLVMRKFLPLFDAQMIDSSYNCRKGKGAIYGVRDMQQKMRRITHNGKRTAWIMKCDIKGFFMSIDTDIAFRLVSDVIREEYDGEDMEWWISLFRMMIYNRPYIDCEWHGSERLRDKVPEEKRIRGRNGVTIGNYPNQIIANLYLTVFDRWLTSRLSTDEEYGRFVDDFAIMSYDKDRLLRLLHDSRVFLRERLRLTLHPDKIELTRASQGLRFCGYIIRPNRIYVGRRTVGNMRRMIARYNKHGGDTDAMIRSYNSYMGFLRVGNSYNIRRRMWLAIDNKDNIVNINNIKLRKYENVHQNSNQRERV